MVAPFNLRILSGWNGNTYTPHTKSDLVLRVRRTGLANRLWRQRLHYFFKNNIIILNRGRGPAFRNIIERRALDLTLTNTKPSSYISGCHVSSDVSFSNHQNIRFDCEVTAESRQTYTPFSGDICDAEPIDQGNKRETTLASPSGHSLLNNSFHCSCCPSDPGWAYQKNLNGTVVSWKYSTKVVLWLPKTEKWESQHMLPDYFKKVYR